MRALHSCKSWFLHDLICFINNLYCFSRDPTGKNKKISLDLLSSSAAKLWNSVLQHFREIHNFNHSKSLIRPRGYKTFFMLNSVAREFFLFINVKIPTTVGILTFLNRKNSIVSLSEPKQCWISCDFLYL